MYRMTLKSLARRKLRLLLTATAIVLGVAFITGTLVITDTSSKLFDDQFARATAGIDLIVRDAATFGAGMGVEVERDPVPAPVLDDIRDTAGVAVAEGVVRGSALLVVRGEAVVPSGPSMGMSWAGEPANPFRIVSGRPPTGSTEVVIDAATAGANGVGVGDRIEVSVETGSHPMDVVGVATFGDTQGIPNSTVGLFAPAVAQDLFGVAGWSEIQIATDAGEVDEVQARLAGTLGAGYEIATSHDTAAASADAAQDQLLYVTVMLGLLAGTALVVGAFMIANTFSILVAQRLREFATLRALGASGRQIITSVMTEASIVGAVASAGGLALGIGAANGLRRLAGAFGVVIPEGPLTVESSTLMIGFGIGLGVTVASALAPARRASRVAPVTAMRDSRTSPPPFGARTIAGVAALGAGGLLVATAARLTSVPVLVVASLAMLIGAVALAPSYSGRMADLLGRTLGGSTPARLGRLNLRRSARRTAATSTALMVGVAVVTLMTIVTSSVKQAIEAGVDDVIRAELMVESARGEMLGGLSHEVHHHASEVPGVEATSRLRFGHWQLDGATKALTAVDPATLPLVMDLSMSAGRLSDLGDGKVVLASDVAAEHGLAVGDTLPMTFSRTGTQPLEVVGIFDTNDTWAVSTGYLISLDAFAAHFAEDMDATVFVDVADETDPAQVESSLEEALAEFPTAVIHDQEDAKASRTRMLDSILGLVTVLLLLAVSIALLGITNSLALSIVERTREIGLLRAVGMSRRQIARMVRIEATLTATVGAITGVLLGLTLSLGAVRAMAGTTTITLAVPLVQLGIYLVIASVGGMAAGLMPGRRASRMEILTAIAAD